MIHWLQKRDLNGELLYNYWPTSYPNYRLETWCKRCETSYPLGTLWCPECHCRTRSYAHQTKRKLK